MDWFDHRLHNRPDGGFRQWRRFPGLELYFVGNRRKEWRRLVLIDESYFITTASDRYVKPHRLAPVFSSRNALRRKDPVVQAANEDQAELKTFNSRDVGYD